MTVKGMTDQQLNRELAMLQGWKMVGGYWRRPDSGAAAMNIPEYCSDIAASFEVQTAAIETDVVPYLAYLTGIDEDFYNSSEIADMLTATPRRRAEAAYMTLKEGKQA